MGRSADLPGTVTRDLLERYLAGDRESERRLFERHRELLVTRARGHRAMAPLRYQCTAEDAVDEVFLRALSSGALSRFEDRGRGSLQSLLTTILDRTLVDIARRAAARKRDANVSGCIGDLQGERGHSVLEEAVARDPTPTGEVRANELLDLCRSLLDEREWRAWELVEHLGLSSVEAADRLGTTSAAVRGLLLRSRKKLIQTLDSLQPDSGN